MFSGALYKQSWKANWIQWLSITLVSCFVLIIIMMFSGGDGLGSLSSSFAETFAKEELTSNFQNTTLNYYNVSHEPLKDFDQAFLDGYINEIESHPFIAPTEESISNAYLYALNAYQTSVGIIINQMNETYTPDTDEYNELLGASMMSLNPNGVMGETYEQYEIGSTPETYDIMSLIASIDQDEMMAIWMGGSAPSDLYDVANQNERVQYRHHRSRVASIIFMAGNMTTPEARQMIIDSLADAKIKPEVYDSFGFSYDHLKVIGNNAILTYQARLDYEISQLDMNEFVTEAEYLLKVLEIKTELQKSITASLMTKLPDTLSQSIGDMDQNDMYAMMVASMYFKIVGLFLAVVYIIVVGIGLIAGQIDSGSMAYVLSTGTKRNTITMTQMLFLVSSTLFMFIATSIVSVICFYIAPPAMSDVDVWKLLLFNAGSFLVTLSLAGIVYFASCIFNRSKHAMALGGGFAVLTIVSTILGMFASDSTPSMMRMDALAPFNSVSVATLFDITSIVNGTTDYLWKFGILVGIAIISLTIGIVFFKKKDLPL